MLYITLNNVRCKRTCLYEKDCPQNHTSIILSKLCLVYQQDCGKPTSLKFMALKELIPILSRSKP